ncbi:MAG: nicotinamide-nucleotide amidase [Gammaproteobacteria bacterium]|nr:nicotinamide-nucleotide amidase [Gammaproteobacteria bacterium]
MTSTLTQYTLEELALALGDALNKKKWTLATAESCTGGWVTQAVTAIAGSSAWFDRGFVTYSNEAKHEMLGVALATIVEHGAVSSATAEAMARGALIHSPAALAVSITGVAGPTGASSTKPVGTVWFGFAVRDGVTMTRHRVFAGDRHAVRIQAVEFALRGLLAITADRAPES